MDPRKVDAPEPIAGGAGAADGVSGRYWRRAGSGRGDCERASRMVDRCGDLLIEKRVIEAKR